MSETHKGTDPTQLERKRRPYRAYAIVAGTVVGLIAGVSGISFASGGGEQVPAAPTTRDPIDNATTSSPNTKPSTTTEAPTTPQPPTTEGTTTLPPTTAPGVTAPTPDLCLTPGGESFPTGSPECAEQPEDAPTTPPPAAAAPVKPVQAVPHTS